MHKRLLLTNVLLAIMSAGAAHAADMPYPAEAAPAMVAEEGFSWDGFYAGIHGGYAWGESAQNSFESGFGDPIDGVVNFDIEGGLAGLTLGYNMQVNNFVFGLEAEGTWADIDGGGTVLIGAAPECLQSNDACTTDYKALGTVTGRAGVAFDRALLFVKGGAAFGLAEYYAGSTDIGADSYSDEVEDTRFGWTVGAGVEFAFSQNVSAKIEYNYIRFEDEVEFEFDDGISTFSAVGDIEDELHIVKAGINYHF
jgi:outer membrane immunogenic protein